MKRNVRRRWKTINELPKSKRKRKPKRVKAKKYNIIEIKREGWENPRENDNYIRNRMEM
jgi:hypothetical protein